MLRVEVAPMTRDDVAQGVLGRGLAYMKLGSGVPVVVAAGLVADHRPLRGIERRLQLRQLRPLAAKRTVWWVNRRRGLDPHASMADIADDYADALRRTFDGPVDVIGISTGGSVALQLAADHPEVIRRLVVAASGSRLGARGRQEQLDLADRVRARKPRAAAAGAIGTTGANMLSRAVLTAAGWIMGSALFAVDEPDDVLVTIEAEDLFDLTGRLGEIRVPVLVVGGTRDRAYDSGAAFTQTADGIPGARLILYQGKGHLGVLAGRQMPRDALAFLDAPASRPTGLSPRHLRAGGGDAG